MAGYYFAFGAGDADNYYLVPGAMDDWRRMTKTDANDIEQADFDIEIEQVISRLTPQQGRAVRLYLAGYTYREIAVAFGVSENAIKLCFYRIRTKLKNE